MWTKEKTKKWREVHARVCIDCGKPCSYDAMRCRKCDSLHRRVEDIPKVCLDCGKPMNPNKHRGPKWVTNRCRVCATKHSWQTGNRRTLIKNYWQKFNESRLGRKYNSGGGRGAGYILVYLPNHPHATKRGVVREHILVWEQAHSKPLPKGWIIHHLNGVKDDNRPRNLVALPNKKHYLVLQAKAKRIQELEAVLNGQSQLF